MLGLGLTFRTPLGALVCLAALLPLGALLVARRQASRAARALGLPANARSRARALVLVAACLGFGLAAAQPAWRTGTQRNVRAGVQAFFVLDVSRSMLASSDPGKPTRLERARAAALTLRGRIPTVPAGLAGFTDRTLPYLFPTPDARVFASTLRISVTAESPAPQQVSRIASGFDALGALATRDFFPPGLDRRICVVLTDGESRAFSAGTVGASLRSAGGCSLLVVRLWRLGERVYGPDGRAEPQYRPDAASASLIARLADAAGGDAFEESQLDRAGDALAALAGPGPTTSLGRADDSVPLGAFAALAGLALVLWTLLGGFAVGGFRARSSRE